eukprot:9475807-Pyramimonas_sp.AAC.1
MEEIEFIDDIGLWGVVPRPAGHKVIGTRWVDVNKGDEVDYQVRSRIVGKEIRHKGSVEQYFAAMPPLASLKMLLSIAVTTVLPRKEVVYAKKGQYVLQFLDVKKAHFWAMAERLLFVELPEEYKRKRGITGDMVGKLLRSMYGMRDAASLWEKLVATKMREGPRLSSGPELPAHLLAPGQRHQDDAPRIDVDWLFKELNKEWTVKVEGIFGPPGEPDTVQSIRTLNRLLTWTTEGIEWECDPRHVDIVIRELGLASGGANTKLTTPGVRERPDAVEEEDIAIPEQERTWYRSVCMRLAYVAQDRPDLGVAVREMAKGMQAPCERRVALLKHAARYLRGNPRLVQYFKNQEAATWLDGWCDADHAGCLRTRKSTSGGAIMA